jgi:putative endonuclease
MEKNKHIFYVLECRDHSYYAGYTNDLEKRIKLHNEGKGAKYTRGRGPVKLVHFETYPMKTEAMRAEYRFKQLSRKQKEKIVGKENVDVATEKF